MYAPTSKAPLSVKKTFFQDLQAVQYSICNNDLLLLVGNSNTHVGSSRCMEDGMEKVIGHFGLGKHNQAGEILL